MTAKRLTPTLATARQSRARLVWLVRRRRQAERHWSEAHSKALNELLKAREERDALAAQVKALTELVNEASSHLHNCVDEHSDADYFAIEIALRDKLDVALADGGKGKTK